MEKPQSLTELMDTVTDLPRGGVLVNTSLGYIQFGSPPETIKDTMLLPNGVPNIFILPYEHFDPVNKFSMAEIEFPIYYNYFLKSKKAHIFVNPDHIENLRTVLQEAIFGPEIVDIESEVIITDDSFVPDIMAEMKYFRGDRQLEDLVDIRPISPGGIKISNVIIKPREDRGFDVYDGEKKIADIPPKLESKVRYDLGATLQEPFQPPEFGITCLGPSHGFDPTQNTSGFLLWINKVGVMVDPPVNSTSWLKDSNVNPKLIDTVILTHCHADHDSGTFQKILEESRVAIYTTPTIMQSFLRKYSAMTRIPIPTLMGMFKFFPVKMNGHYNVHGAVFNFFYTVHSIPTIGFQFSYRNKSFVYSSDHLNDPEQYKILHEKGVIPQERLDHLMAFPWHYDIIYHEAGIPPLHTPVKYLNSLPEDVQKKITVYHIAEKDFPQETKGLTLAKFGIGNTVYPDIERHEFEEAYNILDVFSRIDIFADLPIEKIKDLLLIVKKEHFEKGEYIIKKDTPGDKFYVIVSGNVSIEGIDNVEDKIYGTYEYFGEASLVFNTLRSASVIAATNVESLSIEKESFLRLIRNTTVEKKIRKIAEVRDGVSWNVIKANPFFEDLASSQITLLESIMSYTTMPRGESLVKQDNMIKEVYLLASGVVTEYAGTTKVRDLKVGDLVGNALSIKSSKPSSTGFVAETDCELFSIDARAMHKFLEENPGVLIKLMYAQER